jgi:hypothetical protein
MVRVRIIGRVVIVEPVVALAPIDEEPVGTARRRVTAAKD